MSQLQAVLNSILETNITVKILIETHRTMKHFPSLYSYVAADFSICREKNNRFLVWNLPFESFSFIRTFFPLFSQYYSISSVFLSFLEQLLSGFNWLRTFEKLNAYNNRSLNWSKHRTIGAQLKQTVTEPLSGISKCFFVCVWVSTLE